MPQDLCQSELFILLMLESPGPLRVGEALQRCPFTAKPVFTAENSTTERKVKRAFHDFSQQNVFQSHRSKDPSHALANDNFSFVN